MNLEVFGKIDELANLNLGERNSYHLYEAARGSNPLSLEIRPIYHYKPDRVKAHIFLCILGLLIHKIIEKLTGETAETVLKQLKRIHLTELKTPEISRRKLTQLNSRQEEIFEKLEIAPPKELKIQEDLW